MAAYIDERFMVYADLGRPLHFVPNAGLQLSQVTSSDMGVYSVHVNLNGVDQKSSQTALVHEPGNHFIRNTIVQAPDKTVSMVETINENFNFRFSTISKISKFFVITVRLFSLKCSPSTICYL